MMLYVHIYKAPVFENDSMCIALIHYENNTDANLLKQCYDYIDCSSVDDIEMINNLKRVGVEFYAKEVKNFHNYRTFFTAISK
jgi:hypothetical protein